MTRVNAIKCKKCGDIIFSRARHDMHSCSCKSISIDGGFDYVRTSWPNVVEPSDAFTPMKIFINQTPMELYEDWNKQEDKYGLIKEKPDGKDNLLL